uniref:Ovule protein n=1 Tax=Steinernema glaseri TaxID=37863 RepID=A0A1I8AID7_9BILA
MGQSFSFLHHKNSAESSKDVPATPVHPRMLEVDPRSPTVEISRTPIEVDSTPKRTVEDRDKSTTPARSQPKDLRRNVIERNMFKDTQG